MGSKRDGSKSSAKPAANAKPALDSETTAAVTAAVDAVLVAKSEGSPVEETPTQAHAPAGPVEESPTQDQAPAEAQEDASPVEESPAKAQAPAVAKEDASPVEESPKQDQAPAEVEEDSSPVEESPAKAQPPAVAEEDASPADEPAQQLEEEQEVEALEAKDEDADATTGTSPAKPLESDSIPADKAPVADEAKPPDVAADEATPPDAAADEATPPDIAASPPPAQPSPPLESATNPGAAAPAAAATVSDVNQTSASASASTPKPVAVALSDHDSKNTVNAAELMAKGTFTKMPLQDFIPYDALVMLRLEDGIDPTRKEDYLADAEFKTIFSCSRDEFTKMPNWKRVQKKKQTKLF